MALLKSLKKRISVQENKTKYLPISTTVLPLDQVYYKSQVTFVDTIMGVRDMVYLAQQLPLTAIGIDLRYSYSKPPIPLRNNKEKCDISSIEPELLGITLITYEGQKMELSTLVVDLRIPEVITELQSLLNLSVTFVSHHAKPLVLCLWSLGLSEPRKLWDTEVAERARFLGKTNFDNKAVFDSESEKIKAQEQYKQSSELHYSLVETAKRYHVDHTGLIRSHTRQQLFLNNSDQGYTQEQIQSVAEKAAIASKIYSPQLQEMILQGLIDHLLTIEMPWVITNACMEFHGVRVDAKKCKEVLSHSTLKLENIVQKLAKLGLKKPNSDKQKQEFLEHLGVLHLFKIGNSYSFDLEQLRINEDHHSGIKLLAEYKAVNLINKDIIIQPSIVGMDGRVHPEHKQLEAVTGRQSCASPNLLGLKGIIRPLVVPAEGYGIGEADYAQVEIAITAAVYGDDELVIKFNQGDIYSAMAKDFFVNDIAPEHHDIDLKSFKLRYKDKRNIMKQCTLGIIYGLTSHGLAKRLNITVSKAEEYMEKFLSMFPTLKRAMKLTPQYGAIRGYVSTATGLKRYRKEVGGLERSEKNWMINMPVQGTAAALFKMAGNRLFRLYKQYDAKLILGMHDAFIFEAPLKNLDAVAALTKQVMIQVVQEYYPQLQPRVDLNFSHPECWNKDGDADSVTKWLES